MSLVVQHYAKWAYNLKFEDIPAQVIDVSKTALIDTVAVGVAGARTKPGVAARRHALSTFKNNTLHNATLFGNSKASYKIAAYCNSVSAHGLDMDDTCFAGIIHGSVLIVPLVLAAGEAFAKSGRDILAAFTAGSQIAYSIGEIAGTTLYKKNWWPTGMIGGIGAAVALAKICELEEQQIARAIAFATLNANPFRCMQGTQAKPLAVGETVKNAIEAVELAQLELVLPLDVFERDESPLNTTIGIKMDISQAQSINKKWLLTDPGLVIKQFPLCSCAQAAVEALLDIIKSNRLTENEIDSVHVTATTMVIKTLGFDNPKDENQTMFSLRYPLACVLVDSSVGPQHISDEALKRKDIKHAIKKISYMADDNQFDLNETPEAAIVTVVTSKGNQFIHKQLYATGDPRKPMSAHQFRSKIKSCVGSYRQADMLISEFNSLEKLSNIIGLARRFGAQESMD